MLLSVNKSSVSDIEIYYVYKSWMDFVIMIVIVVVAVVVVIVLLRCVRASHFVRQFGRVKSRDRQTPQILYL